MDPAARQPDRVERDRWSEHGRGPGSVVDREQREHERARDDERRHRRAPTRRQDGCGRQGEREYQWPRLRVAMNGDADDGDAARNHGNGRVEEERKPAAHAPNLALLGVGRVLPQE